MDNNGQNTIMVIQVTQKKMIISVNNFLESESVLCKICIDCNCAKQSFQNQLKLIKL